MILHDLIIKIENKYHSAGIYEVGQLFIENIAQQILNGKDIDLDKLVIFKNRIANLEKKLGYSLPSDYVKFLEKHSGWLAGYGKWLEIENIELAIHFDIKNYLIIEELPDILSEEDLHHIIPIYVENDSYVLMDLRNNEQNKGLFCIWSDEEEIDFKCNSFTEFQQLAKKFADCQKKENGTIYECDFFNFNN